MKKPLKIAIIAGIIVVVIGVSATAAVLLMQYQASIEKTKKTEEQTTSEKTKAERTVDEAEKLAYENEDVVAGTKALDEAIRGTTDSHELFLYYTSKATLLLNNGDPTGALDPAKKAFESEESSGAAAFVGQIAKEKGDNAVAIEYYKKAVELIDPAAPMGKSDRDYYQSIITELGG